MKKLHWFVLSLLVVLSLGTGCAVGPDTSLLSVKNHQLDFKTNICVEPTKVAIKAGQHTTAGHITVWNDGENIYVNYSTNGWSLKETHLSVQGNCSAIPSTKKGKPVPGRFELSATHAAGTTSYTYTINLDDAGFQFGQALCIAAHSVVQEVKADGSAGREETGWGEGPRFVKNNWSMHFSYTVQSLCCEIKVPTAKVTVKYTDATPGDRYGEPSYWDVRLSGVGVGYSVEDGDYDGYCVDSRVTTGRGPYQATLYSSLDPNLATKCPSCTDDEQWDKINYIINQDYSNVNATWKDIQQAIWTFADANPKFAYKKTAAYYHIVKDTNANGSGFKPTDGQSAAVIIYIPGRQTTFAILNECRE